MHLNEATHKSLHIAMEFTYRDEHIMLLKFPIILSRNSVFLHLLFSKLFPEMKQLNMYFLFQIAVLEVQNKLRYSSPIEKLSEPPFFLLDSSSKPGVPFFIIS